MDYTHYLIPCEDKRVRLNNEKINDVHVERKEKVNAVLNELKESDPILEELKIEDSYSLNMLNTIHDVEFGNYCLMELNSFVPKLTNEDFRKDEI